MESETGFAAVREALGAMECGRPLTMRDVQKLFGASNFAAIAKAKALADAGWCAWWPPICEPCGAGAPSLANTPIEADGKECPYCGEAWELEPDTVVLRLLIGLPREEHHRRGEERIAVMDQQEALRKRAPELVAENARLREERNVARLQAQRECQL